MIRSVAMGTICLVVATSAALAGCREDQVELRGDWGQARFTVELADDPDERAKGLMQRETLPASAGMLFIYPKPQRATFWMENTLIPLDMIFIDPAGVVTHIHENAIPLDRTGIDGGAGVLAVLEINGGLARGLGITAGSEIRHPSFDAATAAWPCSAHQPDDKAN